MTLGMFPNKRYNHLKIINPATIDKHLIEF